MRVSIVVNTMNRAASLQDTIASCRWLEYHDFEVIVVDGPSSDHTPAVIAGFGREIKTARCPRPNLSRSRNIGIRLAAGDIVAFIDDDAIPDPGWLRAIVPLFADPEVGAAGGPVFDHTGVRLQAHYLLCDRFGSADVRFDDDPAPRFNLPDGALFCSTLGTNSLFRRDALIAIGGFDEEYDYFLDETDVCLRMVDAGWTVRYAPSGHVYHRYLPSHIRTDARVVSDYAPVIKNKAYFAMRHGAVPHGQAAVQEALNSFVAEVQKTLDGAVQAGLLPYSRADHFDEIYDERIRAGFARAALPRRSSLDARHAAPELPWRGFPTLAPAGAAADRRLHLCFVSQDYPPGVVAGIARVTHELATGLAAMGHVVRVLRRGPLHMVQFDHGVWIHSLPDAEAAPPAPFADLPPHIWGRALAVQRELARIEALRPIDVVQAPNWDCEGLAALLDGRWRLVLAIYTPMLAALAHNRAWQNDATLLDTVIRPIVEGERACYLRAPAMLACGQAILDKVAEDYGVDWHGRPIGLVPHGLPDLGDAPPPAADKPTVDILCVGRVEGRKGTDVLLRAAVLLGGDMPELRFVLAGDAALPADGGSTLRQAFLDDPATEPRRAQVQFLGVVDDATLDDLYRQADIVAVPSRFESFGLPVIEAMMRGRPVIACDVGGMAETVEPPGRVLRDAPGTGLLVPPDDPAALAAAIRYLAVSPSRRRAMGARGRAVFVDRYTRPRMIHDAADFYTRLCTELHVSARAT